MPFRKMKPKTYKGKVRSARKGKALKKEARCVDKVMAQQVRKGKSRKAAEGSAIRICKANKGIGKHSVRRGDRPKTQAQRKATHKRKYGTNKLPPRGTGRKK